MTLGTIDIIDETHGRFTFVNKSGGQEKVLFEIFTLDPEKDDIPYKHFAKFGAVKAHFEDGKQREGGLSVDRVFLDNQHIKGYNESILLHEMMDFDDHELSMMESEQYVMDKIKEGNFTEDEKLELITYHLGFFEANKNIYEDYLSNPRFEEFYSTNPAEVEKDTTHLKKINGVIKYLTTELSKSE